MDTLVDDAARLRDIQFCALDLETTGTNPVFHKILEVGAIRFNLEGVIATFQSLVNPGGPITPESMEIHGITEDMVSGSPSFEDIAGEISGIIEGTVLVIHNPGFDLSFLEQSFHEIGEDIPILEALDTVRLARHTFAALSDHRLETVCKSIGLTLEHHRALDDARGCMEITKETVHRHDPRGTWRYRDLLGLHGKSFRSNGRLKKGERNKKGIPGLNEGKEARIIYKDGDGNISERRIMPIGFIRYGKKTYVHAYCYLRDENRYFIAGRILEIR